MAKALANVERRPSLVDDAYAAMKEAIRESHFAPGYQASAQEIALRLGMSRTPVHEASLKLQEEGLLRIVPKRGIVICALAPDDIRELYDVIIALEGRAAELVALRPAVGGAAVHHLHELQRVAVDLARHGAVVVVADPGVGEHRVGPPIETGGQAGQVVRVVHVVGRQIGDQGRARPSERIVQGSAEAAIALEAGVPNARVLQVGRHGRAGRVG